MHIVITGASRGIGLELTRIALRQSHQVLAVARNTSRANELMNLQKQFSTLLQICETDVASPEAPAQIANAVAKWPSVDLLINNAGVLATELNRDAMIKSFEVNTIAPLMITQALIAKLQKSKAAKVVHITSKMGSIADNTSGGYYAYRASKAALNMVNRSLDCDYPWLTTIVIHPGWVKTDMGGEQAPTEVVESAAGIWKVSEELKPADSGEFYDFRGERLAW